jgi:hypothetical protein
LIGRPAQERVDLGLDRLLHEEADGDATDLLEDGRKVLLGAEQRVDLCADALTAILVVPRV